MIGGQGMSGVGWGGERLQCAVNTFHMCNYAWLRSCPEPTPHAPLRSRALPSMWSLPPLVSLKLDRNALNSTLPVDWQLPDTLQVPAATYDECKSAGSDPQVCAQPWVLHHGAEPGPGGKAFACCSPCGTLTRKTVSYCAVQSLRPQTGPACFPAALGACRGFLVDHLHRKQCNGHRLIATEVSEGKAPKGRKGLDVLGRLVLVCGAHAAQWDLLSLPPSQFCNSAATLAAGTVAEFQPAARSYSPRLAAA